MASGYSESDNFIFKVNPSIERFNHMWSMYSVEKNYPMLENVILSFLIAIVHLVLIMS